MNRTFQLHGSGASYPRASNALGLVRVVFLRYSSSPAVNGPTPGVPNTKHMKVHTRTQLVSMPPAARRYMGQSTRVNRLERIPRLPGYVPRPLVFEVSESWNNIALQLLLYLCCRPCRPSTGIVLTSDT